jgi:CheY-like chemotaxis protein
MEKSLHSGDTTPMADPRIYSILIDITDKEAQAEGAEGMLRKPVKLEQLQLLLERFRKLLQQKARA